MSLLKRRYVTTFRLLTIIFLIFECGCAEKEQRVEERGRHVRVRAPFTRVDVWIPEEDDEDPRVKVEVDD